jgi:hypothetical protein
MIFMTNYHRRNNRLATNWRHQESVENFLICIANYPSPLLIHHLIADGEKEIFSFLNNPLLHGLFTVFHVGF